MRGWEDKKYKVRVGDSRRLNEQERRIMWWNKKCEVWKKEEGDGEVEEGWEREWDSWQIPGLWSSVLNAQEVSRCAKMTLYNNSFGFMLWVVYTLCVSRDNHEAANDPGSYFYRFLALLKNQLSLPLFYDNSASLLRRCIIRLILHLGVIEI